MKKHLFLLTFIISLICLSQIRFENGYFIDNNNQQIQCLIKNMDWKDNPTEFEYKIGESGEIKIGTIKELKEFGIYNELKFVRETVNMDRASENVNYLSDNRNPEFKEETLFLKVLSEGQAVLYGYMEGNLKRYFFQMDDGEIEQLVYKKYKTGSTTFAYNNQFRNQLKNSFKCTSLTSNEFSNLQYKASDMTKFFNKYNHCVDASFEAAKEKRKSDFNLSIRPRVNFSSLEYSSIFNDRSINLGNSTTFGIGVEIEYILPYNKNKWGIITEPTYMYYKAESTTEANNVSGGKQNITLDYSSIELPLGLRYYFFLNEKSKLFLNAFYVFNFNGNKYMEVTRADGSLLGKYEIKSNNTLAFGFGYNFNSKFTIEGRYFAPRDLFGTNPAILADYKSFSLIVGYNLF